MDSSKLVECTFLIPLHRDTETSDGQKHSIETWNWLTDEMFVRFNGWMTTDLTEGAWKIYFSIAGQVEFVMRPNDG